MKKVKSLKVKISLWYTLFLLLVAALLFIFAFEAHTFQQKSSIEKTLIEVIADTAEHIESKGAGFAYDDDADFYRKNVYVSIYDEDGAFLFGRRPVAIREYPGFDDKQTIELKTEDKDKWFVYDSRVEYDDETIWIRGITNEGAAAVADNNMVNLMLIVLPLLILVAFGGGILITSRGFEPIMNIVNTANEIRESGDLSKRISLDDKDIELAVMSDSVNQMLESLENLVNQEKQFTSDVSHELRTPISVIKAQSELALDSPEDSDYAIRSINAQSVRMQNLLNRLLLLSRSDAGTLKLEREEFNLSEVLEDVVEQQSLVAAENGLEISASIIPNVSIIGDELMLMRVVLNLIDNAIKYTKGHGSKIEISLEKIDEEIIFSVKDDGIGIAKSNQEKIWKRFYRVDESRSDGSAGLGLSMADSIVKTMGGRVLVESEEGKGSCFGIILPTDR